MARKLGSAELEGWRRHADAQAVSGKGQEAYCREQGLSLHAFRFWKYRRPPARAAVRRRSEPVKFVAVRVASPPPAVTTLDVVLARGRVVRVSAGFDEETLRRVVCALEGEAC